MGVILLNPDDIYPTKNGGTIGPLRMTEGCSFDLFTTIREMIRRMEVQEHPDVREAYNDCLELVYEFAHKAGLEIT